jgi:hypothetical protein
MEIDYDLPIRKSPDPARMIEPRKRPVVESGALGEAIAGVTAPASACLNTGRRTSTLRPQLPRVAGNIQRIWKEFRESLPKNWRRKDLAAGGEVRKERRFAGSRRAIREPDGRPTYSKQIAPLGQILTKSPEIREVCVRSGRQRQLSKRRNNGPVDSGVELIEEVV